MSTGPPSPCTVRPRRVFWISLAFACRRARSRADFPRHFRDSCRALVGAERRHHAHGSRTQTLRVKGSHLLQREAVRRPPRRNRLTARDACGPRARTKCEVGVLASRVPSRHRSAVRRRSFGFAMQPVGPLDGRALCAQSACAGEMLKPALLRQIDLDLTK